MAISTGAAILGSTIGSALIGGYGAKKQADVAKDASAASIAEQRRQFDLAMQRSQPFYEGSLNAYNSLLAMEGLPGVSMAQPERPSIASGRSADLMNDPRITLPRYKQEQVAALRAGERPSITSQFMQGYGTRDLF